MSFLLCFHANEFFNSPSALKENCFSSQSKTEESMHGQVFGHCYCIPGGMAHTESLRPKGISFSSLRCIKGYGFNSLKYIKVIGNLSFESA